MNDGADRQISDGWDVGSTVGRYVILETLSRRSSSTAFAAFDTQRDQKVALKLFAVDSEVTEDRDRALHQWIVQHEPLKRLRHPNLVQTYEIARVGEGILVAMEFVDGISLRRWMEARDDPFPWQDVLRLCIQAGLGLAAAHGAGVVHGDVNPDNIMVDPEGRVKIMDFGLAQFDPGTDEDVDRDTLRGSLPSDLAEDEDTLERLLAPVAGSAAYIAPEQHLGSPADARSDQFAFCASFYEALYGERPFQGDLRTTIAVEELHNRVRPSPEKTRIPAWLRASVLRGLSARPADRHPSMQALLRTLDRDPRSRRRRWAKGLGTLAGVGAMVAIVGSMLQADQDRCQFDDTPLEGTWDATTREQLETVFDASQGRQSWQHIDSDISTWVSDWLMLRELACHLTKVRHEATVDVMNRRHECLDDRLAEMTAFVELYRSSTTTTLGQAQIVLDGIVSPWDCQFDEVLEMHPPLPLEHADEISELRLANHRARLALRAGDLRGAESIATEIAPRIERIDYPSLRAKHELLTGELAMGSGDFVLARSRLHRAIATASAARLPHVSVRGWIDLLRTSTELGNQEDASVWVEYAVTATARMRDPSLKAELADARGDRAIRRSRPTDALAHYRAALEWYEKVGRSGALAKANVLLKLGRIASGQNEPQLAQNYFARCLALNTEHLGADHPRLVEPLTGLASADAALGNVEEAIDGYQRALTLHDAGADETSLLPASIAARLGELELSRDNFAGAEARFQQAADVLDELGTDHHEALADALAGLGRTRMALGDAEAARSAFEQALGLRSAARPRPQLAHAEELLATLLWQAEPTDRERALVLASLARDHYAASAEADGLARVEAWIASRSGPAGSPDRARR